MACFVGNKVITVPSHGATTLPSVGSTAIPLPKAPAEKAASSTFSKGTTLPLTGELITSFSALTFLTSGLAASALSL